MRVSNQLKANLMLSWLQRSQDRLLEMQVRVASGRRILTPADDPSGAARVALLRGQEGRDAQYLSGIDSAEFWLKSADPALKSLHDVVQLARDLGLQGTSAVATDTDRATLATQVRALRPSLLGALNTRVNGRYLFAGQATTSVPFEESGSPPVVSYLGSDTAVMAQLDDSTSIALGVTGEQIANLGGAADPGHIDLFAALEQVAASLESGNVTAISAALAELEYHAEQLVALRAELGARAQTCEATGVRLRERLEQTTAARSLLEEADLTEALVELSARQNAYQAAAGVAAMLDQVSLLDYLR